MPCTYEVYRVWDIDAATDKVFLSWRHIKTKKIHVEKTWEDVSRYPPNAHNYIMDEKKKIFEEKKVPRRIAIYRALKGMVDAEELRKKDIGHFLKKTELATKVREVLRCKGILWEGDLLAQPDATVKAQSKKEVLREDNGKEDASDIEMDEKENEIADTVENNALADLPAPTPIVPLARRIPTIDDDMPDADKQAVSADSPAGDEDSAKEPVVTQRAVGTKKGRVAKKLQDKAANQVFEWMTNEFESHIHDLYGGFELSLPPMPEFRIEKTACSYTLREAKQRLAMREAMHAFKLANLREDQLAHRCKVASEQMLDRILLDGQKILEYWPVLQILQIQGKIPIDLLIVPMLTIKPTERPTAPTPTPTRKRPAYPRVFPVEPMKKLL